MSSIFVTDQRGTDALKISVKSLDPFEASLICNTLVDIYKKNDLEWVTGEMTHLKSFLLEQLLIKESELDDIEKN